MNLVYCFRKNCKMVCPTLTLDQGQLKGSVHTDYLGERFYSFKGIPYAKPPTDELRFKAPLPAGPWLGVLDATRERDICYQIDELTGARSGSEDCLYLNVHTKKLLTGDVERMRPVIVYVHGGSFQVGSGNSDTFGPEFLMAEDVVVVTLNYRLGILGFLSFEDPYLEVPGNAGLKDIVMALRWVKDNITYFCGDPINVTLMGHSAGAAAVHYLILSPQGEGLFQRAILQSLCALNIGALGRFLSLEDLQKSGVDASDTGKALNILRRLPVESLYDYYEKLTKNLNPNAVQNFLPVVENTNFERPFLSMSPMETIRSGQYNHVPTMIGFTDAEGLMFRRDVNNPKLSIFKTIEANIPYILEYANDSPESHSFVEQIKQFYFGNKDITEANFDDIEKLHTDTQILMGIMSFIKNHSKTARREIYLYKITTQTRLNFLKQLFKIVGNGVCHGDEIGYLFKTFLTPNDIVTDSVEDVAIRRFVKLWTNFARCGNPTPIGSQDRYVNVEWKPVDDHTMNVMEIGESLTMSTDPEAERTHFWKTIFNNNNHCVGYL